MGGHVHTAVAFCMHLMALKMIIALLLLYMNWSQIFPSAWIPFQKSSLTHWCLMTRVTFRFSKLIEIYNFIMNWVIYNENSNYYFEDQFNHLLSRIECSQNLSFLHANILSLKANRVMFESFINDLQRKFSIIGLTETWLTPVNADLHTLPGYCHVYRCRQGRQGGGVSLFISNNLPFIVRQDLTVLTEQVEQLFIEIDKSALHVKKNVIIGIIYRPPDKDPLLFNDIAQTALAKIDKENKFGYLLGDFNLDLLKSEIHNPTLDFLNSLFSYSFWPLITRPTRMISSSATLIDNIFSNNTALKMSCVNGIVINDITDHFPIFHICKDIAINEEEKIIFKRNFTHKAQLLFTSLLQDVDWGCILNESDTNKAYAMSVHVYSDIYNKAFPKTRAKIKYYHRKPWLTEVLKNSIRQENKLFKLSKKYPVADWIVKYKTYRSTLNKLLKRGEKCVLPRSFQWI